MSDWTPDLAGRNGPLYLAIADAIADDIRAGRLAPGARLPTHRDLADRLEVTVGTVSRGYAEAARRGWLSGEVGRGTFARGPGGPSGIPGLRTGLPGHHPDATGLHSGAAGLNSGATGHHPDATGHHPGSTGPRPGTPGPRSDHSTLPIPQMPTFFYGDPSRNPTLDLPDGLVDLSVNNPPLPEQQPQGAALQATLASLAARTDLQALLSYQPDAGAYAHRVAGARWIRRTGLEVHPDQVLICNGSQHAMATVFSTLVRPGELVLTEALTYPGMKALANLLHFRVQGVAFDVHGLRPDALEAACRAGRPRALYCIPTLQNPTASVMPGDRRREIAAVARAHDLAVIEDDIHGLLPEHAPPPLSSYAPELSYYLTSTSKCLSPGLRIGYLAAPPATIDALSAAIRTLTWMAAPLMAEIASIWIEDGTADALVLEQRREAEARQAQARALLGRWEYAAHPSGYHLWLHLPDPWRSETFVAEARSCGVAVTPAEAFIVGRESAPHAVRVCLGGAKSRLELDRALRILAETLDSPPSARLAFV